MGYRRIYYDEPPGPWNGYQPAAWTPSAYEKTLNKHSFFRPDRQPNHKAWGDAVLSLFDIVMQHANSKFLDWQELDKPWDTSPGYPYMLQHQRSLDMYQLDCELQNKTWEDIVAGLTPYHYVFLKQEQVKKQKVADEDIRAIYVQPDSWARCQARFDQDFNRLVKQNRFINNIAVGMVPFWELDLAIRNLGQHPYYVEKDFSRFDGTIPASILLLVRAQRWDALSTIWHTPLYAHAYQQLSMVLAWKELIHPTHRVYAVSKGNPSGQVSTSIDNSLVNLFLQFYVSFLVYGRSPAPMLVYGDDVIQAYDVEPDPEAEAEVLKHTFGMYLKPDSFKVLTTPIGLSFCGYTVQQKRGRYIPVYNPQRIIANLWRPVKNHDLDDIFWSKLISATILLWESPHRDIPLGLLRYYFLDSEYWVPPDEWFDDIFWDGWRWPEAASASGFLGLSQAILEAEFVDDQSSFEVLSNLICSCRVHGETKGPVTLEESCNTRTWNP